MKPEKTSARKSSAKTPSRPPAAKAKRSPVRKTDASPAARTSAKAKPTQSRKTMVAPKKKKSATPSKAPATAAAKASKPSKPIDPPATPPVTSTPTAAQPSRKSTPKAAASATLPSIPAPGILSEGDTSVPPPVSGPGARYALAPTPSPIPTGLSSLTGELPSAYGTGRLILLARDPHWVYAHWDLTDEQIRSANRKSASGTMTLRIRAGSVNSPIVLDQDVHPESRNWFVHVPQAGTAYLAELGYRDAKGAWTTVSTSQATLTPTESLSDETWVRFETMPFDVPMEKLVALVKQAVAEQQTLLDAIPHSPSMPAASRGAQGRSPSPSVPSSTSPIPQWTAAQEKALSDMLSMDEVRRVWIGSLEITELLRRQLQRGISSAGLPVAASAPPGLSSLTSPFGAESPATPRGFWFNVNAELIVYGATDPAASVTIGNRPIRLRPDGSFSYRFALPDGDYSLPIAATSPDGVEQRHANLAFRRASEYHGSVPAHPQDDFLRVPAPENVF